MIDLKDVDVNFVKNFDDASQFWSWLTTGHPIMGFDIETTGLDWVDGKIRLAQFGTADAGWAIPAEQYPGLVREALEYLRSKGTLIIGHNVGGFDLTWARHHYGFIPDWSKVHDTMLLAALIDTAGARGLKELATAYVDPRAAIGAKALADDFKKYGWWWDTVPVNLPSYWVYGVLDTILTVRLFLTLLPIAEKLGLMDAYATERHVEKVMHQVSFNGLMVDTDHCLKWQDRHAARCEELQSIALTEYGLTNIGSGPQLAQAFEATGVNLSIKTKTGKWKMDADTLEIIAIENQGHPLTGLVSEYRKGMKYGSYYGQNLAGTRSDGRVHPSYRQVQARTLRMSATDPPIQTQPRTTTNPEVRNSFIAPEGFSFISADQSNAEARIFAILSGDEGMQETLRNGTDLHCWIGGLMYNNGKPIAKDDPRRNKAKNTFFCCLFGGGAEKVAITAGIPLAEAEETLALMKSRVPTIKSHTKAMQTEATIRANDTGRSGIRLADGRLLRITADDDAMYKYCNYSIQGTARMILGQRLIALDNAGLADRACAVIHDEVCFEVPDADCTEFAIAIEEYMTDAVSFPVPMAVNVGQPAKKLGHASH